MTTKTDAARECAKACLLVGIAHDLSPQRDMELYIHLFQREIEKHFPPSVPVSKLKEALNTADLRTTSLVPDIRRRRAELLVTDIQALIAEAE